MNGDVVIDSVILIDHFNSVSVDALQAAAARQHGLRLATRNTKDFPPERFAFVHVPYK
jgi:hypothetical protein